MDAGTYFTYNDVITLAENETGQLHSINYPYPYPQGIRSAVTLFAPLGQQIVLVISDLDIVNTSGCTHSYLRLVDGFNPEANDSQVALCGKLLQQPAVNMTSYLNTISVEFWAELGLQDTGSGYLLEFTAVPGMVAFPPPHFLLHVCVFGRRHHLKGCSLKLQT